MLVIWTDKHTWYGAALAAAILFIPMPAFAQQSDTGITTSENEEYKLQLQMSYQSLYQEDDIAADERLLSSNLITKILDARMSLWS